jgi:hypothetical protein
MRFQIEGNRMQKTYQASATAALKPAETPLFSTCPYVGPEPVLANDRFLVRIKCREKDVSTPA